jgi:hypothetical protein
MKITVGGRTQLIVRYNPRNKPVKQSQFTHSRKTGKVIPEILCKHHQIVALLEGAPHFVHFNRVVGADKGVFKSGSSAPCTNFP